MDEEGKQLTRQQASAPRVDATEDALRRINAWLELLEEQALCLLANCQPEELTPAQMANLTGKYLTFIIRFLELRQELTPTPTEAEDAGDRLLRFLSADPSS